MSWCCISLIFSLFLPLSSICTTLSDNLIDLLLLVDAELAGAAVDQQEKTTNNRENLEEVVLGEVLVGVVVVELKR